MGVIGGTLVRDTVYEFPLNEPLKQQLGFPTLFIFTNDNGNRWDVSNGFSKYFNIFHCFFTLRMIIVV